MGARISKKSINQDELFLDRLPSATQKAFFALKNVSFLKKDWYLAGGTALTLQVGHRQSVDLDFFSQKSSFSIESIIHALQGAGSWDTTHTEQGTVYGKFLGAKMSLISYPFFVPSDNSKHFGAIRILSPEDIAIMKIIAISQRGRKRDFVDMFWLCNHKTSLFDIFHHLPEHYPQQHNIPHLLKSLTYFEDAESDPMPRIYFTTTWKEIKAYFLKEVPLVTRKFLLMP